MSFKLNDSTWNCWEDFFFSHSNRPNFTKKGFLELMTRVKIFIKKNVSGDRSSPHVNEILFVDVPIRVLHGWTSFNRSGNVPCFHTWAESNRGSRSSTRLSSCGTHLTHVAKYLVLRKSFHIVPMSRWHSIGLLFGASETVWVSSKIRVMVTDVSFERVSKSFSWILLKAFFISLGS